MGCRRCLLAATGLFLFGCLHLTLLPLSAPLDPQLSSSKAIPMLLHQTWDDSMVPSKVANWIRSWNAFNPDLEHHLWTDDGVRQLLEDHFDESYSSLYDDYPHRINRADVRRLLVLYQFGGVFADLDVECLQPLWPTLSDYECILSSEPTEHRWLVYNQSRPFFALTGFMACAPQHPFFRLLLQRLANYADNARSNSWNMNILNSTGPIFVSEVLEEYTSKYNRSDVGLVHVASPDLFTPTFDPALTEAFRIKCHSMSSLNEGQRKVCRRLQERHFSNQPKSQSLTNHHWMHSWSDRFVSYSFKDMTSISDNITVH